MNTVEWIAILIPVNVASYIISSWCFKNPDWGYYYFGAWTLLWTGLSAYQLARSDWHDFLWSLFALIVNFISWWICRRNRKRKRATELAGYKAKAIQEKLAAKQRETAQHRPVLKPLPESQ